MKIRLYIFDADNTLRRTTVRGQPCPRKPGEWELLPCVKEVLSEIPWGPQGPFLGVASNQDQIAYGRLTSEMALRLLAQMVEAAVGNIHPPPCLRFCPHPLHIDCDCRKPAPGMLFSIMRHFGVPAAEALFIGDAHTDHEAATRAGIRFRFASQFFGRITSCP